MRESGDGQACYTVTDDDSTLRDVAHEVAGSTMEYAHLVSGDQGLIAFADAQDHLDDQHHLDDVLPKGARIVLPPPPHAAVKEADPHQGSAVTEAATAPSPHSTAVISAARHRPCASRLLRFAARRETRRVPVFRRAAIAAPQRPPMQIGSTGPVN